MGEEGGEEAEGEVVVITDTLVVLFIVVFVVASVFGNYSGRSTLTNIPAKAINAATSPSRATGSPATGGTSRLSPACFVAPDVGSSGGGKALSCDVCI